MWFDNAPLLRCPSIVCNWNIKTNLASESELQMVDYRKRYLTLVLSWCALSPAHTCTRIFFWCLLCFGIEDVCGPAIHEAGVSCEPQHHHEHEDCQDIDLSVTQWSQAAMLFTDHFIRRSLLLWLDHPTTPRPAQAATQHCVYGKCGNVEPVCKHLQFTA